MNMGVLAVPEIGGFPAVCTKRVTAKFSRKAVVAAYKFGQLPCGSLPQSMLLLRRPGAAYTGSIIQIAWHLPLVGLTPTHAGPRPRAASALSW